MHTMSLSLENNLLQFSTIQMTRIHCLELASHLYLHRLSSNPAIAEGDIHTEIGTRVVQGFFDKAKVIT
jgi:hypothetical protein